MSVRRDNGRRSCRATAGLFVAVLLVSLLAPAPGAAADDFEWPGFETTEPVTKRFTLIRHYPYRERLYKPSLAVQPVQAPPEEAPPPNHNAPEAAMIAQLSAMKALDFDWWLSTWEPQSRERFLASGKPPEHWLDHWEQEYRDARVELVRFIETQRHVILTFRRSGVDGPVEEHTRVLAPVKGGWMATLALESSPGPKYFLPGASRERKVR